MVRLVALLAGCLAVAMGLSWLADRPGNLIVNWQGYEVETSVFRAVVMLAFLLGLAIVAWSVLSALWRSPASVGQFFNRRRQMRGLEALSGGMIAIGAGDRAGATRFAVQARKTLPNEPLTQLLRAQAAQLTGDRSTARRMFEAMLGQPETEQMGLRGLFLEAEREGEREAARQFAERSVSLNPQLGWAVDALFDLQCKDNDWAGALTTLGIAKKHQHHDKAAIDRRRAVLMTARAMALEETDPNRAMGLAIEAHHLAHDLIPAAALAGRMLAARGHTKRAAKIIERAWRRAPHPDLAIVHAHARIGDSPRDRLERVKRLAQLNPHSIETPIAIATAAIEAKDWETARRMLEPLDAGRMTQRVCMLMARIDAEETADKGRAREWLARAVHAPRDPAWVADGAVSDKWAPVSPVTGAFDAFQWRVPADALDAADTHVLAAKLEELVRLGAPAVAEPAGSPVVEPVDAAAKSGATAHSPGSGRKHGGDGAEAGVVSRLPVKPSREAVDVETVTAASPMSAARAVRVSGDVRPGAPAGGRGSTVEVVSAAAGPAASRPETRPEPVKAEGRGPAEVRIVADAKTGAQGASADRKPLDPGMFIAPRAPDDPGVVADDGAERPMPVKVVASGQR